MASTLFIVLAIFIAFVSSNGETDTVRIINSGSTNTASYVIELQRNGIVKWIVAPRFHPTLETTTTASSSTTSQNSIRLPSLRTNSIFQAVEQAFPFDQYAPVACMKSVSFGTRLHVSYNGQNTPDLNCPVKDQQLVILNKYVHELIADLNINTRG